MAKEKHYRYHPYYKDRPQGVLTQREREYLAGESDIEPKSDDERKIRQQIRDRVREGILDFRILFDHLEERDRNMIFSAEVDTDTVPDEFYRRSSSGPSDIPPRELETVETGWVGGASTHMIGFIFQHYDNHRAIENKIEDALQNAIYHRGFDSEVEVSINVDITEDLDSIESRLEQEGPTGLTARGLRALKDAGRITDVEHAELSLERAKEQEDRERLMRAGDDFDPSEPHLYGTVEKPEGFERSDKADSDGDKD